MCFIIIVILTQIFKKYIIKEIDALYGWIGRSGWMQGQTTSAFVAFAGKNAVKHVVSMVGIETLFRMALPAIFIGGVGGGLYGRINSNVNPKGNFIGI